jgi:hypothetical protein
MFQWYNVRIGHTRWEGPAMDRDTFTETIRAFKNRTPYKPFTIATVNGNRYEIDFPDAIVVREGLAMFVGPGRVPVIFDHEGVSEVIGDLSGHAAET